MKVCSFCRHCYDDSAASCTEVSHPALSEILDRDCEAIAGFCLESLQESGRKGEVYHARHIASGQACLIRVLPADERNCQQFLSEGKVAAALIHPNVAGVYETGSLKSGEMYVVSEEASGKTLREYLEITDAPPLLTSIQVIRQVAEALHEVHKSGLTHRGVCPENILLTTDAQQGPLAKVQN